MHMFKRKKSKAVPRDRDGICVIEVIRCEHLPDMDIGSLTDAFVECKFIHTTTNKKDIKSVKLKTGTQQNSLDPVFHSFLAFPFYPPETDALHLKIIDKDFSSRNDDIGIAEIPFKDLCSRIGDEVTLDIQLEKKLKSLDGGKPSITIRLVELESTVEPQKITKEFFVIRHGESIWNEKQASKDIVGMVRKYDHELTKLGIEQAQMFNERWSNIANDPKLQNDDDLQAFLSASAIFASPLTRATQTALLTCKGHPFFTMSESPLVLLRNLRECKNFGSFDTVGKYVGAGIEQNVKEKLTRDLKEDVAGDLLRVQIDPYDAVDSWWNPLQQEESDEHIHRRFTKLWAFLRYGTQASTAILVGHSHFFRHMCKEHVSPEFRQAEPEFTKVLDKHKLDNAGCLRITVEWDTANDPMDHPVIHSARLVFDSKLVKG